MARASHANLNFPRPERYEGLSAFRFEIGQRVRVITHPAKPFGAIVNRWPGKEMRDVYGENIYAVSSFVTKQRESSLEAAPPLTPSVIVARA